MATARARRRGGQAVKVVVTGPFAAGKTTLIRTISEITVLSTERGITDSTRKRKAETTVAMDFGRITIDRDVILYLFGTPGQERFWFLWNGLFEGALGAVVLVDTRRLEVSFDVMGRLEERGVPFVVAVNTFPDGPRYPLEELRSALDLPPEIPIVECDVRRRASSRDVLMTLMRFLHTLALSRSIT